MVERGMEYEAGTENGGRGLKAWQDDTGERALDVFVPGCVGACEREGRRVGVCDDVHKSVHV